MIKTFQHTFKDGTQLEIRFDLSKPMPYCETNFQFDKQPLALLEEYHIWQERVLVPELLRVLSPSQLKAFAEYGKAHTQNRK